ncbi:MAG: hypothetical protein WC661_05420 [Opitutaceae bacterium]|jgi:hypothetical protein
MPYEPLDQSRLTQALRRLGALAVAEGIELELSLYGGAVFTLVYGSRDSTKDVDALIRPSEVGQRLARQVAREQGLPEDWINSDVAQFLSEQEAKRALPADTFGPGLVVTVPTAAYLLALKLRACRPPLPGYPGDAPDIRFLLGKIKPVSLEEVEGLFARFFPSDTLTARAREIVETALSDLA